jgi:hypothetical protein
MHVDRGRHARSSITGTVCVYEVPVRATETRGTRTESLVKRRERAGPGGLPERSARLDVQIRAVDVVDGGAAHRRDECGRRGLTLTVLGRVAEVERSDLELGGGRCDHVARVIRFAGDSHPRTAVSGIGGVTLDGAAVARYDPLFLEDSTDISALSPAS